MPTQLSPEGTQLDRLRREHRALDQQIQDLERRPFLSDQEEAEVKRLKRLKLFKKDEIAALVRRPS